MKALLTLLISTVVATAVNAQARKLVAPGYQPVATGWGSSFLHEFDLNLSEGYLKSYKSGSNSITDFNLFAAYSYDFRSQFQLGGDVGFQSYDSETRFTLAATGTYNFNQVYADSFFAKGGLGIYPVRKITNGKLENKNELGLYIAAGKRFKIWEHVNYKPFISIAKISDIDPEFTIQFLNISLNTDVF